MSDRYVRLLRSIWTDDDFRALDQPTQWLYMALISQPDMSAAGVLPLIERRWAGLAAGLDPATISRSLDTLEAAGFVVIDVETGELWVRSYIRHDGLWRSPNGRKAVDNSVAGVLSPTIARLAQCAALEHHPNEQNPRSTRPHEAPPPAPPEGDTPPQQPAAISHHPRTSSRSQQPQPLDEPPDKFTADVIDHLVGLRLRSQRNIHNPAGYRRTLAASLPAEHSQRIEELHERFPTATASSIAAAIDSGDTRPLAPHAT